MRYWQKPINTRISLLKTWYEDIKPFPIKSEDILLTKKTFKYFSENWKKWNKPIIFNILFIISFMNRFHFCHFPFSWEDSWLYTGKKIIYNGLHITLSQICNMQMLFWSYTCSFLGFNFLITLNMSFWVKFIVFKDSFVLRIIGVGKLLLASIWGDFFAKNELDNLVFFIKVYNKLVIMN